MALKNVLFLDLGTQTGWALLSKDQMVTSGTVSFKQDRFQGGGMRFLRFKTWLEDLKKNTKTLDAVYFEEVRRHKGTDAAHIYGGFLATLTTWCELYGIPYEGVPVSFIKKCVSGQGNASKKDVIFAIRNLGFLPKDDNEADAQSLLFYFCQKNDITNFNIVFSGKKESSHA